jgi:hypothetical protein
MTFHCEEIDVVAINIAQDKDTLHIERHYS